LWADRRTAWALCVALDCEQLTVTPVRVSLADLSEVERGRSAEPTFHAQEDTATRPGHRPVQADRGQSVLPSRALRGSYRRNVA
jgi:hypothetical protein